VPVIRDADKKDVYELARELAALSEKARAGKLTALEMQGASFTVSSLGGYRRHFVHADHQCAGSRDSRRGALEHAAGLQGPDSSCRA
jgi:pyruvate/2-oxoglutarate dehydrogenase complex dihydrolipoamide acyltransferase (E2) component